MSNRAASDPGPCFEWTAFEGGLPTDAARDRPNMAQIRPGVAIRDGAGRVLALHPAPAQWLVLQPDAPWLTALRAAQAEGRGVLTDVTGRWRVMHTPPLGPRGSGFIVPHPLTAAMPIDLYLRDRDVAALWVFDCPVLVVRQSAGFDVWVEASYEAGLLAAGM